MCYLGFFLSEPMLMVMADEKVTFCAAIKIAMLHIYTQTLRTSKGNTRSGNHQMRIMCLVSWRGPRKIE
jgi:hypothetical protein